MNFEGTAVQVYDTPVRYGVAATPRPWGRIAAILITLVLLAIAGYVAFGVFSQAADGSAP